MKKAVRRTAAVLLAVVFAGSVGALLYQQLQYRRAAEDYAQAQAAAGLSAAEADGEAAERGQGTVGVEGEEPLQVDLEALQAVNGDVVGWIAIPGTDISYPVLQGRDNQYYLDHTWRGERNAVGAIFLDARNDPEMEDFNTILYGHRMNNDSMFGQLHRYSSQEFWREHPWVYVAVSGGVLRYEIFAAYEADVEGSTYWLEFPDQGSRLAFLEESEAQSVLDAGKSPGPEDRILTLSTCTGRGHDARWVVKACLCQEQMD